MDRLVIDDLELKGKQVLTRVDFNVPVANGKVGDVTRIEAALPTIKKVIDDGGRLILMSHLGRPKGAVNAKFSLKPVSEKLAEMLGKPVQMASDCVGEAVRKQAEDLKDGEVLLLENTRFHKEETENDPEFSKELASLGEVFVNDAFGAVHRAHASTVGVTKNIKENAAGYLLLDEVKNLSRLIEDPEKPYVIILGGAKVADKLKVIRNLVTKATSILIGGGMAYTFLRAKGENIGASLLDEKSLATAFNTMTVANNSHPHRPVDFMLPLDHTVATGAKNTEFKTSENTTIEADWRGVDIGPATVAAFTEKISCAKSILWNGPMGIFEDDNFAKGTMEIARAVAAATENGAFTVVGGGDSIAAIEKAGMKDKISHVSTGGGASLEFMAGIDLPGIMALSKAKKKVPVKEKAVE